jgi:hypothetical protein
MSKEGSFEYEMEKIARMVLTVTHTHKEIFKLKICSPNSIYQLYSERDIMQSIYQFFGYSINNMQLQQLVKQYPDVFDIKILRASDVQVFTLNINEEYADALEIW